MKISEDCCKRIIICPVGKPESAVGVYISEITPNGDFFALKRADDESLVPWLGWQRVENYEVLETDPTSPTFWDV
jgi:hypothetical protein